MFNTRQLNTTQLNTAGINAANVSAKSTVIVNGGANTLVKAAVTVRGEANTLVKAAVSVSNSANTSLKSTVGIGLTASISAKSTLNIVSSAKINLSSTVSLTDLANILVKTIVSVKETANVNLKSALNVELEVNIRANMLALHFHPVGSRKNPIVIKENMYHRGSARFVSNSQNIVNKLWVKGGKAQSELYTQDIVVGTIPILLFYSPRTPVTVIIGGAVKTLGIQNVDSAGTKDFLLNVNEKLLIPDLVTTGIGTISYLYEYPIKILLEEPLSQVQYGIFEDVLIVKTDDRELAIELGLKHLFKYSQPVISGSLSPFTGTFKAGETIKVEIPRLKIDGELLIKKVALDSTPMEPTVITLNLETLERDLSNILKDLKQRLDRLEKDSYKDDEGPILKYIAKEELYSWTENAGNSAYTCPLPSEALYPTEGLYPC